MGGRERAGWIALICLLCALMLPGQARLPVIDRDEALFVQASRQMVEDRAPIDIRFQDEARYKKPVGIYWLQSLAALASGEGAAAPLWVWRIPSLAGAMASVWLTVALGATLFGVRVGLPAGALMAAAFVLGGEARIAKTDAVLLALILAMLIALARLAVRRGGGRAEAWGFWLAFGAAVLIKGPIGPLFAALAAAGHAAAVRDLRWLRPLGAGWPVLAALALVAPWLIGISLVGGWAFWREAVVGDLAAKVVAGQEGKGAPPGTYLAVIWLAFWPGAALLPIAARRVWQKRDDPRVRFALAAIVPAWIVFEAVPTKLFHYTMPTYPAAAILIAAAAVAIAGPVGRGWRAGVAVALLPLPLVAVALGVVQWRTDAPTVAVLAVAAAVAAALAGGAGALALLARGRGAAALGVLALAGGIFNASLLTGLARTPFLWPTEAAAAAARDLAAARGCEAPRLAGRGYGEPSLVWAGGRDTPRLPANAPLPETLAADPCAVVLNLGGDVPAGWAAVEQLEGLAIGAGRVVRIELLQPELRP
jgi:4-amino-4-deoxy-L-arabinose transferase-like glycosyltransferase